ncbi:uncharacterized protein LOC127250060 [Andrographis paniculata]|uniref:uncharacterized protein LOC127250060 n=1 Tax=Andrographis paniculata TaxID=175694 RepID=UPI0021E986B1|nr:uncharacterized protein LOC127250060 [Andrographis paniculata]
MGCSSSKAVDAGDYRPAQSSFAVFDITAIEEPWLKNNAAAAAGDDAHVDKQPSHVPPPILEKLKSLEDAPRSWDEVSKALEDLKPKLNAAVAAAPAPDSAAAAAPEKTLPKNRSYRTLEDLEAKVSAKPVESTGLKPSSPATAKPAGVKPSSPAMEIPAAGGVARSLKDNIFIVRDRQERENAGKSAGFVKRDPLADFEEKCPTGGGDAVVIYTTSLGGVRRTYEDCNRVRQLLETHQVVFDERDVALDAGFRSELRELLGEGAGVPRLFVKGRYIGGVEEAVALNETGRLSRILNWARVARGVGRQGCGGCGGARFVPCLGCGGSCKIVIGESKERCGECNENGLVQCPICPSA